MIDGSELAATAVSEDREVETWLDHPPVADWRLLRDRLTGFVGPIDPRQIAWLLGVLRCTRADGSPLFGPRRVAKTRLVELERWVRRVGDPHLARVIGWWRPSSSICDEVEGVPPPLPSAAWPDRALAVLRPDWTPRGDCVAVDHRRAGSTALIEVAGRGVTWLGPAWTAPGLVADSAPARPTYWTSGAYADAFEWSFRAGPVAVTRTAVLIRGGHLALLMQTEQGVEAATGEVRWTLPAGVEARPDPASRALILSAGRGRPTARLIPLGLPESNYPTDRGSLEIDGRAIVLRQRTEGPNRCLALLVSWRKQPPRGWRTLTVAEKSATCPPGAAFGARVSWGTKQTGLLIYRSLAATGLRSVLGYQTRARLIVGAFAPTGDVHPWIKAVDAAPVGGTTPVGGAEPV